MSSPGHQPVALTSVTSSALLASSWIGLAVNAITLDEQLKTVSAKALFIRLCEQLTRPIPDLGEADKEDIKILRRRAVFLILRIWAREKWSYYWLATNIPLKDQTQFFKSYTALYAKDGQDDSSGSMTDHHLMSTLFNLRWEIQIGLKRHFVRKPPGPVVPTGSSGYQRFAGSLPTDWTSDTDLYEKMGKKETLQGNIDKLKKTQSEIRCGICLPSEEQLVNDQWSDDDQSKGLKVPLQELRAQICYELAEVSMLQMKFNDAKEYFDTIQDVLKNESDTIFISFNRQKFTGYYLACTSVLQKRSNAPISADPMAGKGLQDIPDLLKGDLKQISQAQRHCLVKKLSADSSSTKGRGAMGMKTARISNMLSNLLNLGITDNRTLAEARRKPQLVNITLNIIQDSLLSRDDTSQSDIRKISQIVRQMLFGLRDAAPLSEFLNHPVARRMLSDTDRLKLQSRVEFELTPSEPDPDFEDSSEDQLTSAIDPAKIHKIVTYCRQHAPKKLTQFRVRERGLAAMTSGMRHHQELAEVFLAKVEQLTTLKEYRKTVEMIEYLGRFLHDEKASYAITKALQVEQTRIEMLEHCQKKTPTSEFDADFLKRVNRTVGDLTATRHEKTPEVGPHWVELGVVMMISDSANCKIDKHVKDPILKFAQRLWYMNSVSAHYRSSEARAVWDDLCVALLSIERESRHRRCILPSQLVLLCTYLYNEDLIEILITFLLHVRRLNCGIGSYSLPVSIEMLPRENPKHIIHPVANMMAIDDSVDLLLGTGMEIERSSCTKGTKFIVIKAEVLLLSGKGKEALSLLLADIARKTNLLSGAFKAGDQDMDHCPIKMNQFVETACTKRILKLIGECLETNGLLTPASIAYFYGGESTRALQLARNTERWDGMMEWYECIYSIDLLEFFCSNYHRRGLIQKRDEIKRLIQQPHLNSTNSKRLRHEVKNHKLLFFLRRLWRLHSI